MNNNNNNNKNKALISLLLLTAILGISHAQLTTQCPGLYYMTKAGDTGSSIAASYAYLGVTYAQLVNSNPFVNFNLPNLASSYQYICIPLSSYQATVSTSTSTATPPLTFTIPAATRCTGLNYYLKPSDTVNSLCSTYSVSLINLQNSNPTVNFQLAPLAGYYTVICIPLTAPTQTTSIPIVPSTPQTITTAIVPSITYTQPTGITGSVTCGCCANYAIIQGDTCYDLVNRYLGGQSGLSSFLSYNPYINCANLQPGQRICIPNYSTITTGSSMCSRLYVVSSGDICHSISQSLRITLANLYACNSGINSGCSNLQPGQIIKY